MDAGTQLTSTTSSYRVQLGTWTNWSNGPVFGATLTLTRRDGNLLIAFVAFFVSLAATRLWRIFCLEFHRWHSTPEPRDALHHQRQAIFRNSASAEVTAWSLGQLYWAWRSSGRRPLLRTIPAFLIAIICVCGFIAASGFSSRISTGIGNEVLIDGSHCGLIQSYAEAAVEHEDATSVVNARIGTIATTAANYGQQCYSANSSGVFDCTTFVVDKLPGTVSYDAPCPFQGDVCRSNTSNIVLDTGYIDSNEHLGLNTDKDEKILFREVYHCAPLLTKGHSENVDGPNENYTRYYYGKSLFGTSLNRTTLNYTFEIESLESQYLRHLDNRQRNHGLSTRLVQLASFTFNGSTSIPDADFIPSHDYARVDGDVYMIFLIGNGVSFLRPTNDSWYRGTISADSYKVYSSILSNTSQTYIPEEAASPMGCVEQFQFCNAGLPAGQQCGPLAGFLDAVAGAGPLFNLSPREALNNSTGGDRVASRFLWFTNTLLRAVVFPKDVISTLHGQALASTQTQYDGFQGGELPTNQWQLDAKHWWEIWLASLQGGFVNAASGLGDALDGYRYSPGDSFQQDMCNGQKIRTTQHTSFSLFGLYFILVAGAALIITSYALEPIYECLQRRKSYKDHKCREWKAHEILHLQRLGYQGFGERGGTWSRCTDNVPITKSGELLDSLAVQTTGKENETKVQKQMTNWSDNTAFLSIHKAATAQASTETINKSQSLEDLETLPTLKAPQAFQSESTEAIIRQFTGSTQGSVSTPSDCIELQQSQVMLDDSTKSKERESDCEVTSPSNGK